MMDCWIWLKSSEIISWFKDFSYSTHFVPICPHGSYMPHMNESMGMKIWQTPMGCKVGQNIALAAKKGKAVCPNMATSSSHALELWSRRPES